MSVLSMTKLRIDEYRYACTIDYVKQIIKLVKDYKIIDYKTVIVIMVA